MSTPKNDFNCPICRQFTHFDQAIICKKCESWFHFECVGLTSEHNVSYFCCKCSDPQLVVKRLKVKVSDFYPFKCSVCSKLFMTKDGLRDHGLRFHQIACPFCGKYFVSKIKLQEHIENWHDESEKSKVLDTSNRKEDEEKGEGRKKGFGKGDSNRK